MSEESKIHNLRRSFLFYGFLQLFLNLVSILWTVLYYLGYYWHVSGINSSVFFFLGYFSEGIRYVIIIPLLIILIRVTLAYHSTKSKRLLFFVISLILSIILWSLFNQFVYNLMNIDTGYTIILPDDFQVDRTLYLFYSFPVFYGLNGLIFWIVFTKSQPASLMIQIGIGTGIGYYLFQLIQMIFMYEFQVSLDFPIDTIISFFLLLVSTISEFTGYILLNKKVASNLI